MAEVYNNCSVCESGMRNVKKGEKTFEPSGLTNYTDRQEKLLHMIYLTEGGYANLKGDSGKETYRGISRVYHPNWSGWEVVDQIKARQGKNTLPNNYDIPELKPDVYRFYYETYYVPMKIDNYKDVVMAALVFHRGIGMGSGNIGMLVTRAVNRTFGKGIEEPQNKKYPTDEVFKLVNGNRSDDVTENFVIVAKQRYKNIDDKKRASNPSYPGYYEQWCRSIYKDIEYCKSNF